MSRHDVSWKKRNAVARASRGGLRCLAVGTKRKPLVAKLAGQPLGLGNEVALLVETDKHRCLPGPELLAIGGRSIKAKGDRRHAPGDKLAVLGWPISQRDIRFTLSKAHDTRAADHFEVDRRIAFMKRTETIDEEALGQHAPSGQADKPAQFRAGIEKAQNGERRFVHGTRLAKHRFAFGSERVAAGTTVE